MRLVVAKQKKCMEIFSKNQGTFIMVVSLVIELTVGLVLLAKVQLEQCYGGFIANKIRSGMPGKGFVSNNHTLYCLIFRQSASARAESLGCFALLA